MGYGKRNRHQKTGSVNIYAWWPWLRTSRHAKCTFDTHSYKSSSIDAYYLYRISLSVSLDSVACEQSNITCCFPKYRDVLTVSKEPITVILNVYDAVKDTSKEWCYEAAEKRNGLCRYFAGDDLSGPHAGKELGQANIVRVELVAANQDTGRARVQETVHDLAQDGSLALVEVIYGLLLSVVAVPTMTHAESAYR